jgi:hypothetical protein
LDEAGNFVCQTRNDQQYKHGALSSKQAGASSFFNYQAHDFATCRHATSGNPRAGHDMDILIGDGYRWVTFDSLSATVGDVQLPLNTVRDGNGNPVCQSKTDEQYGESPIAAKQGGALSWYKYAAHDYATCRYTNSGERRAGWQMDILVYDGLPQGERQVHEFTVGAGGGYPVEFSQNPERFGGFDTVDMTSDEIVVRTYRTYLETTKDASPVLMSEFAVSRDGAALYRSFLPPFLSTSFSLLVPPLPQPTNFCHVNPARDLPAVFTQLDTPRYRN